MAKKKAVTTKKKTAPKKKAAGPQKVCPKCGAMNHVRRAVCVNCGYKFEAKATPKKKAGTMATPTKKAGPMPDLKAALKVEREALQRKIDAIDQLLED